MKSKPEQSSKGQSSLHFGTIEEVYPNGTARVKLEDMDGMTTMPIPVGHHNSFERIWYWMPSVGQPVACLMDEKGEAGVVLCGIYTESNPPPVEDLNKFHFKFGDIEITGDVTTGVIEANFTRIDITNPTESTINGKAIAVVGAVDSDGESDGPDTLVTSGQL
ncbi:MAG: hypothetical protein SFY66_19850 [Oculatellaceae cyanobacterium bins.114]|nr:hypothetical protein [Oculatellaceae cyanobacterium bins.114]